MPKTKSNRRFHAILLGLLCSLILGGCPGRKSVSVNPPSYPMTASCSADRSTLWPGQTAVVFIAANDSSGSPLTYAWSSPYGSLESSGASARWTAKNVAPGTYDISVHADNGRGASVACAVKIVVRAPAPKNGGSHPSEIPQLPKFPAWTLSYTLPAGVTIASETEELGLVFDRLRDVLVRAGIVSGNWSAYGVGADGFAIVSRIEHIDDRG